MEQPISPHLQVYRLPLTAIFSITHRFTSVLLSIGAIKLIVLLMIAATSPKLYEVAYQLFGLWWVQGVMMLWTLALYFHLCHGIRHLLWDISIGFSARANNIANALTLIGAIALNVLTWLVAGVL